jgi:hypothetical protein
VEKEASEDTKKRVRKLYVSVESSLALAKGGACCRQAKASRMKKEQKAVRARKKSDRRSVE